jgi:hypothetical protein
MRIFWWTVTFVVIGSIPSVGHAQWPNVGHHRQGRPGMPPVNGLRDPFILSGVPGFPHVPMPTDITYYRGNAGMPLVNASRDPFLLSGVPGNPRVPTPADIATNYREHEPTGMIPGVIPSGNPIAPQHISPMLQSNAQIVPPKFDEPKPTFLTSSKLRWLLYGVFLLVGGAFRAMFRQRRNNT